MSGEKIRRFFFFLIFMKLWAVRKLIILKSFRSCFFVERHFNFSTGFNGDSQDSLLVIQGC